MMGMGEPLQNYAALVPALRTMLDDHGYGLSRRRVTVSTSGVVPMIDRLRDDCPVALAVSLHAPNDALRDELVPLNRKYPLAELLAACGRYLDKAPRDFITFEYCMLDGVNDSDAHARELLALVATAGPRGRPLPCKFNLIPFNPFPAVGPEALAGRSASPRSRGVLQEGGLVTTVRKTRGDDIDAACGQLAGEVQDRTHVERRMVRASVRIVPGGGSRRPASAGTGAEPGRRMTACPAFRAGACWPVLLLHRPLRGVRRRRRRAQPASPNSETRPHHRPPTSPTPQKRARARMELASAYFGRGQMTTALDQVKLAIQADPTSSEAFNLRGLIYANLGDQALAEESFRRALQINPRDADTMQNFGWYLCQQKRYPEAERAVRPGARRAELPRRAPHPAGPGRLPGLRRPAGRVRGVAVARLRARPGESRNRRRPVRRCCTGAANSSARGSTSAGSTACRTSRQRADAVARGAHREQARQPPGRERVRHPAAQSLPRVARGLGLRAGRVR